MQSTGSIYSSVCVCAVFPGRPREGAITTPPPPHASRQSLPDRHPHPASTSSTFREHGLDGGGCGRGRGGGLFDGIDDGCVGGAGNCCVGITTGVMALKTLASWQMRCSVGMDEVLILVVVLMK